MKEPQVNIAALAEDDPDIISAELENELLEKHGPDLTAIQTVAGAVVLRKPSKQEFVEYRSRLFDDDQKATAMDFLARTCCVHPDKQTLAAMCTAFPGIVMVMSEAAAKLSGLDRKSPQKKLGKRR